MFFFGPSTGSFGGVEFGVGVGLGAGGGGGGKGLEVGHGNGCRIERYIIVAVGI